MTKESYTSLELSKKLAEARCELESECAYVLFGADKDEWDLKTMVEIKNIGYKNYIPAYDILNDICCKYVKKFFKDKFYYQKGKHRLVQISRHILQLRQQNKKQKAEVYIKEHCIFLNSKNN